ncbi:DUF2922 domain-containing protein [Agrilactobacillus fermenti]|uniref:DUF2922 domain-containing protein n=1 Tax=Agrilactobacillus fermenti TaxID=2586909 RepID=UPI001E314381|nr:DUF2922 domain-containing protein [Agrilactobacillus fermenti]MCD2256543.1 DUF2922 domain-containing protein [Agrilactobacillus fermenti]
MKHLQLNFKTSEGKKRALVLNDVKQDLSEATVKGAMQKIADSKLFVHDGVALYTEAISAQYVERNVSDIFTTASPAKPVAE